MIQPIIKKGIDLTQAEIEELDQIYLLSNPKMPKDHIKINHIEKTNPVFFLYKVEGKIAAFQAYTSFKKKTPFHKKKIPVIYLNLSYKNPEADKYIKNFAKTSNLAFIKMTFGRFWFLKKFVMVFQTYNPKLIERISAFFAKAYPNYYEQTPKEVQRFSQFFFKEELKLPDTIIDKNLVKQENYTSLSDITDKWEQMYNSQNPHRNNFFFENDIIQNKEDQFFLTGKALFFVGFFSIWPLLYKKLLN